MTRIRAGARRIRSTITNGLARIRSTITWPFAVTRRWWDGFDSAEGQVATAGLLLLGVGVAGWTGNPFIGLAIAGALLVAMSLGFRLDRPRGG